MATQVRTIRVINKVDGANEIRKLSKQYGQLNKGVKSTADTLGLFKRAFQVSLAGIGLREITRAADQFQLLRDRIKVFTGSQAEADKAFTSLTRAARFTRTSVAALAESYNRVALSTQELGLSSKQIIGLTVGLQQSFRLAGSTIAEAGAATIQLTQGLASGQLRGQELRSVLEQNAVIGKILAKELGVTRGQLIKFAESGKITSEVVLASLIKNIDKLNRDAAKLGTTFEQSVTIVLDAFRVKLDEVNRSLGLSTGFEKFALSIADNTDIILQSLAGLAAGVVITFIPKIIAGFRALQVAIASNPVGLLLVGLSTGIALLAFNWEKSVLTMQKVWLKFRLVVAESAKSIFLTLKPIDDFLRRIRGLKARDNKLFTKNEDEAIKNIRENLGRVNDQLDKLKKPEAINSFGDDLKSTQLKGRAFNQTLGSINAQLQAGQITLKEYDRILAGLQLEELNNKFREGKIDIDQYNKGIVNLSQNLTNINPIARGAEQGLRRVATTAGNVAQQISQSFTKAFTALEDAIFQFTKKGVFDFQKFSQAVIDEITRIVIRAQIIAPIAQGIGQLLFGGGGAGAIPSGGGGGGSPQLLSAGAFANGGVFNGGKVTAFANGGIVGGPTVFPFANGVGLMGEAGPEAIMPLTRRNGKLGVEGSGTVVNINNMVGGEVETSERQGPSGERILDVTIKRKIQESLSDGSLDRDFSENFGLRRRGS